MYKLPPNVTMRELLTQAVSRMTSATSYDPLDKVERWDGAFMEFMTSSGYINPFMLIVGESYLDEIQKYAYYYATKLKKKCWYLCLETEPMPNVLSMLNLASGIPLEDLLSFKVAPPTFGALNDGAAEIYKADCWFSLTPPLDLDTIVSLAKRVKKEGVEVLFIRRPSPNRA